MSESRLSRLYTGHSTEAELASEGLCNLCLGLRAQDCGASDPLPVAAISQRLRYLRNRLREWKQSNRPADLAFDEAVRALVTATLAMVPEPCLTCGATGAIEVEGVDQGCPDCDQGVSLRGAP